MRLLPAVVFSALILGVAVSASAQMEMPKPIELKKLNVFTGTWSMQGDMKPGAMGSGGSMTETETCKWMDGEYFLVCDDDFKSSMGNGTGVAYMGYDAGEKMYTYDAFNSMGEAEHAKGTVDGDTWTWNSEERNLGGEPGKARFTIKVTSPTTYTFKFDMSKDGSTWTTVMDGKASKEK